MDLGSLIALLKLVQDVQEPAAPLAGKLYTKEKALHRAETGLGL